MRQLCICAAVPTPVLLRKLCGLADPYQPAVVSLMHLCLTATPAFASALPAPDCVALQGEAEGLQPSGPVYQALIQHLTAQWDMDRAWDLLQLMEVRMG